MKDENIFVNDKHVGLRTAAFILAILIAVGAFSFGISRLGKKEAGYQTVTADADEEAPLYASGFELRHYFDGSSNEIKQKLKLLNEEYSTVLKRGYKLLDSKNEYTAYQNIAALNAGIGEEINVNAELYAVLKDAYEKTMECAGFNMFAGALYNEWNSILTLDNPQEFDPLYNENERERIALIAEEVNDLSNFTLEFLDDEKYTVKFTVSEKYKSFAEDMELEGNILDLNTLHDAYLCDIIEAVLEEKGYTQGYIITDSGISVSLSQHDEGTYLFYDVQDGTVQAGGAEVKAGTVCSVMKSRGYTDEEMCYYEIDGHLRSPNFSAKTGDFCELISSSCVISHKSAADTVYMNMKMASCGTEAEIESLVDTGAYSVIYMLQSTEKTVFVNPSAYQIFSLPDGEEYTAEIK